MCGDCKDMDDVIELARKVAAQTDDPDVKSLAARTIELAQDRQNENAESSG